MKKRLAIIGACTTLLFSFGAAAPASADNGPHMAGAGIVADGCAGCHRTHTAVAAKLLKTAMPALCLTCHGATGTGASSDVVDGLGYPTAARGATAGALRGGGFSFALINSATPGGQSNSYSNVAGTIPVLGAGVGTSSAHTVDGTTGTAWGNGAISTTVNTGKAIGLTCGSCHDPHGNGTYRILKNIPMDSGGTSTPIADSAVAKVYTTTNYWKVEDTTAPAFIANVSAWCTTCHTRYLSGGDGATPSGDALFTYRHKSNDVAQGKASCIQCHVSHGSNAAMAGVQSAASTNNPGDTVPTGSSKLLRIDNRGTCQMCHNR
ncbi:MAG: cytochrome c3 family protein [Phycicoccus sp.]|nr:cytochrome c3 family protein [Phycicoccus sp.]